MKISCAYFHGCLPEVFFSGILSLIKKFLYSTLGPFVLIRQAILNIKKAALKRLLIFYNKD